MERRCERARIDEIAESLAARPRCYVHRDFQSQNIVVKSDQPCFIDFQGMRLGFPQYDLASLLSDPYVTLTDAERRELLAHYIGACESQGGPLDADFEEVLSLCATQRLMQALGAYGFLSHVKDRARFLDHIPAAFASLQQVLAPIPGLDGLRAMLGGLTVGDHYADRLAKARRGFALCWAKNHVPSQHHRPRCQPHRAPRAGSRGLCSRYPAIAGDVLLQVPRR